MVPRYCSYHVYMKELPLDLESVNKIRSQLLVWLCIIFFDSSGITERSQNRINRQMPQQGSSCKSYQFRAIAGAEDLVSLPVRGLEVGHILHNAHNHPFELTNHIDTLHHDHSRKHLRR